MPAPKPGWGSRPSKKQPAPAPDAVERFVNGGKAEARSNMVRLNIDVERALRARIKHQCSLEGRSMNEVLLELILARFPE
jgi:hypothetical protein